MKVETIEEPKEENVKAPEAGPAFDQGPETKVYDGEGNEVVGQIQVIKILNEGNEKKPYHLELNMSDEVAGQILQFGSSVVSHVDILQVGIRGAVIERLARVQAAAKK